MRRFFSLVLVFAATVFLASLHYDRTFSGGSIALARPIISGHSYWSEKTNGLAGLSTLPSVYWPTKIKSNEYCFSGQNPKLSLSIQPVSFDGKYNRPSIAIQLVASLNADDGEDKVDAQARQRALTQGKLPAAYNDLDSPELESRKVIKLGRKIWALDQVVLSQSEDEDLPDLDRETIFYLNDKEVIISADPSINAGALIPKKYLASNPGMNTMVWRAGAAPVFYKALASHRLGGRLQQWYDNYDQMLRTIKIG